MKQPLWPSFTLGLTVLMLTACGSAESNSTALQPLDRSQWPASETIVASVPPTPFPMVDEALIVEVQAKAEAQRAGQRQSPTRLLENQEASEAPTNENRGSSSNLQSAEAKADPAPSLDNGQVTLDTTVEVTDEATLETEITAATETLIGTVVPEGLNVRNLPNANADVLFTVAQGDSLALLAVDEATGWVKVQTENNWLGWVNGRYLDFAGQALPLNIGSTPTQTGSDELTEATTVASIAETTQMTKGEPLLVQPRSGGAVFVIGRDGAGLQQITSGLDPVLSPDGKQIAFTRWGGGEIGQLWIANSDGSGERLILGGMRKVKSPSWSPASSHIAINFQDGGTLDVIRDCHNLSSGEPDINFWQAYDVELEFSDQGFPVRICWKLPPDPHWKLRVVDVKDATFTDLPAGRYAFAPTWDPNNANRIVSVNRFGLVQTDVNQGEATLLTNDGSDRGPVFSPDGRYIAVTYKQHDHWEVHRLNADGSGRVRLTKTPLYAVVDSPRQWNNASPVFSPDSSEIAFLTDRNDRWEVWVMNLDGSNQRPLFSDEVQAQLNVVYEGNDARMLGWGNAIRREE